MGGTVGTAAAMAVERDVGAGRASGPPRRFGDRAPRPGGDAVLSESATTKALGPIRRGIGVKTSI